jgi:uncharacterized protein (TIGR02453 family)
MKNPSHFQHEMSSFFQELAIHQHKEWFHQNKARYESTVLIPVRELVAELNIELSRQKIPLSADPAKAIFRINRDVRFSQDKSPYKTNVAAVLSHDGVKGANGLLYLHFSPEESFAAVGFYGLSMADLTRFREHLACHQKKWLQVENNLRQTGYELEQEDHLKRLPRGFVIDEVSAVEHVLRLKNYVTKLPLTAQHFKQPSLLPAVMKLASASAPLLQFGWAGLARS